MKNFMLLMIAVILSSPVFGVNIRFKNLSKDELKLTECDFYPNAAAMILTKKGYTYFDINEMSGIYCYQSEGYRIKIFKEEGKEWANVKIRYYSPENNADEMDEQITDINAYTYNLMGNEVVKTKMERSAIYRNRLNPYWQEVSFTLPNVQAGSVIEYSFTKRSKRLDNLEDWYFQYPIPVRYNEETVEIPQFLVFQANSHGNIHPMKKTDKGTVSKGNYVSYVTEYSAEKILPLEEEPFVANEIDLPFRLKFQLIAIDIPNMPIEKIAGDYDQVNKKLCEMPGLGQAVKRGTFARQITGIKEDMSSQEKADTIYEWVKRHLEWNKRYGVITTRSFKACLNEGKGSASEINLALTAAFREHGLEAYPVILSTRGHGVIHPVYPNLDDFNYVISVVSVEGKAVFYDATEDLPGGLLPVRCLNGNAWMVREGGGVMIPLKATGRDHSTTIAQIKIEDGQLQADVQHCDKEYAALNTKSMLAQMGKSKFEESLHNHYKGWEVKGIGIARKKNAVTLHFQLTKPIGGDVLYIQPFLYGLPETPLFKRDTRQSIIDFPYNSLNILSTQINVPEGYQIELPKTQVYRLGKNDALLNVTSIDNGNRQYTISVQLVTRKLTYVPAEYAQVKEFFEKVAEVAQSVVVLKKG